MLPLVAAFGDDQTWKAVHDVLGYPPFMINTFQEVREVQKYLTRKV
jgi:hypothetical protein